MPSGHCIVIVRTSQIEALMEQIGEEFAQQYFTVTECQISRMSVNLIQYFSSRLAAKSAVFRTLNLEENVPPQWHNIEIQRLHTGEPTVVLYAKYQEFAIERGIQRWLLSISHTPHYAAASTIALCNN